MSLCAVSDGFLARRAARGDEPAFVELARRYRPLIVSVARRPPLGADFEDARQEALIGLLKACRQFERVHHDRPGAAFAGVARLSVHRALGKARIAALTHKRRVLGEAVHEVDEHDDRLAQVPAPAHSDPANVVVLRELLGERARWARRGVRLSVQDGRRRYSDAQIKRAVAMVAGGGTVGAAAHAIGAAPITVRQWVEQEIAERAGLAYGRGATAAGGDLRYRYTQEQVTHARQLVADGHTITDAAATVGVPRRTVARWIKNAP